MSPRLNIWIIHAACMIRDSRNGWLRGWRALRTLGEKSSSKPDTRHRNGTDPYNDDRPEVPTPLAFVRQNFVIAITSAARKPNPPRWWHLSRWIVLEGPGRISLPC